jgi:replicative DNA helicase
MQREAELASYSGEYAVILAATLRDELSRTKKDALILRSGLPTLDNLIDGFELGELTIITGPTKGGKTLLAQTFTETFIKRGHDCLWFPYEVSGLRFIRSFGEELPAFAIPRKLKTNHLDWLRDRIEEAQIKYGIRAVFIDHLHFLCDMAKMRSPSLEIGAIMRRLVGITHDCDVAMFLIAHMTKIAPDKEPDAGDTRDSSFIEQECDNTLAVWRSNEPRSTKAKIKVIHNRRNGVRNETFQVEKIGPYLREITEQAPPPDDKKGGHWWSRES